MGARRGGKAGEDPHSQPETCRVSQNPERLPKMLPPGITRILLLSLIWGAAQPTESNSSFLAACQGYPDLRGEPQGEIHSPREVRVRFCSWVILGGPGNVIALRFLHFNLICGSEALVIQAPDQAPRTLCGSHAPEPLQFQGGNVSLIYRREWVSEEGFQLKYERGHRCPQGMPPPCPPSCNLSLGDFYGVFSSPAFSLGALPGAAHCQWALDPHDSRPLTVRFTALDLGPGDSLLVYEGVPGAPARRHLLRSLGDTSNGRTVSVDSPSSRAWVLYQAAPGTGGRGFNATYHVRGYCVPWELPCGAGDGEGPRCYGEAERCDGTWDCADGADEEGCNGCGPGCYSCGGGHAGVGGASCYSAADRCNYQTFCADAADERRCQVCQPGNFLCRDGRCIYESWVCDGQADCADASDEESCAYTLPRKVVTAAVIGSLVCGLLLVIALGCTCRLYALRTHHYGILAPLSRMEAQMVQRQAPPSYGQLIARGVIPPVEDFPTESPSQGSMLGNLRSLLQLLRQDPSASGGRRPHRSRSLRRVVRRLRRWGLLPRAASSTTTTAAAAASRPAPDAPQQPPPEEGDVASSGQDEQAPPLPQKAPLPAEPAPAPPVPAAPPAAAAAAAAPPPRLSGVMRALRVRLFSTPARPEEGGNPLHAPPSPQDEDDVLLLPLSEPHSHDTEAWDPDDDPLLT